MFPELEKPGVTEIQVRIDCNGCVQKIKKALHGINGIYDLYIDLPQQKLIVVGWADPEKIIKAIKKTRKVATICSHTEPTELADQPTEPAPEGETPAAPDATNHPPTESSPTEGAAPPAEPPPPENQPPDVAPSPGAPMAQPMPHFGPKVIEEVHVIHRYPPDNTYGNSYSHGYGEYWNSHPNGYVGHWNNYLNSYDVHKNNYPNSYDEHWNNYPNSRRHEQPPPPPPVSINHNAYKPSPYISEYEYIRSPPRHTQYSRREHYSEDYHNRGNGDRNIYSMFSDENPNACRIV